ENALRDLGFHDVRVRHHELSPLTEVRSSKSGNSEHPHSTFTLHTSQCLARIEVGPAEMGKILADGVADKVTGALKKTGYTHVTLDLHGYRRGSLNKQ
ncbi:MAG: hypothetical protein ABSE90_01370, partial [Verrucomicrobiota bacterium]